jgi:type 1 glutamine amidotransferase/sugar phosphate isomerase/epimerase
MDTNMTKRRVQKISAASLMVVCGGALGLHAQTSTPTRMTLTIERGPAWSRLRTAIPAIMAGGGRITDFQAWNVAAPLDAFGKTTFFEALEKQDPLFVSNVEGITTQQVSSQIAKNLDYNLTADEVNAIKEKLSAAKQRLIALDAPGISSDEAELRRLFQFARSLNVATIVSDPPPGALRTIDSMASEFNINVAILNQTRDRTPAYADPRTFMNSVRGLSKRVGACVDTAGWMQEGIQPSEGLNIVGDRVLALHLLDRSALGKSGQNVTLGSGSGGIFQLLASMYKTGVSPAFISVGYTGSGDAAADLAKSFNTLDKGLQPVAADRVDQLSKTIPIRGPDRLAEADRAAVLAAVPPAASVQPKKPRKLLVLDLNIAYPGHGSIPAANMAIRLWGEKTGAYTPVFDNNLENLKYPKIKEFDAVFLNNTVGQLFVDPAVREGLIRYIREGGGLGAYHGTPHASIDWAEFGDMLAARAGSHRDPKERAIIRIEDPGNPVTAAFGGKEFEWQDEFFRFTTPPWSRDKVHVLLSFDTEKTDLHQKPDCEICDHTDNDYPVSWIRSYGQGRIFYTTLGHLPALFERPAMAKFVLAGIQFILGDLDADTTPGGAGR